MKDKIKGTFGKIISFIKDHPKTFFISLLVIVSIVCGYWSNADDSSSKYSGPYRNSGESQNDYEKRINDELAKKVKNIIEYEKSLE
ncbi:MAG: hypothetical protein IJU39_03115 [Clostridia bacterium]|nr:hypothetical protein [Clostridia bacterium]